jgi:predicted Fe-S protein YdhL (DUF1289 family)
MTYPAIKAVRIFSPCRGICTTTTVGSIYCRGCHRYWKDVISWNAMDDGEKIMAMKRAAYHRSALQMGLVDGDNIDYDQESIHSEVERRLRETDPEAGTPQGG